MTDAVVKDERRRENGNGNGWKMAQRAHFILELLSAIGSMMLILFFAIGFQFKTPAMWLRETNLRIDAAVDDFHVVRRAQNEQGEKVELQMNVTCSKLTNAQIVFVPLCRAYRLPGFPKTP